MTVTRTFTLALADMLQASDDSALLPDQLARACVASLDVAGAGLSYTLLPDRRLPLGASDPQAAAAERLQYATGEGPCLTAQRDRSTVIAPLEALQHQWPVFTAQLTAFTPYRCVVALPVGGPLTGVAALDIYLTSPDPPSPDVINGIATVAALAGTTLAADLAGDEDLILGLPRSFRAMPIAARHRVWLAIGHLSARRSITTTDALALLRAIAFTTGTDLETTANRILTGELPTDRAD